MCIDPTPQPVFTIVSATVDDLQVDGTLVFFLDTSGGTVSSVPVAGGAVTELASGQAAPTHLALDASYVYWTNKLGGAIWRAPKTGASPELVVSAVEPTTLLVDGQSVYWTDTNNIYSAPKAGGSATTVVTLVNLGSGFGNPWLAQNATSIFFQNAVTSTGPDLYSVPKKGGSATYLTTGSKGAGPTFAADDTNAYVPCGSCAGFYGWVSIVPLSNPGAATNVDGDVGALIALAGNGEMFVNTETVGISKLDQCAMSYEPVIGSSPTATSVALDATWVYWSDGTSIYRALQ